MILDCIHNLESYCRIPKNVLGVVWNFLDWFVRNDFKSHLSVILGDQPLTKAHQNEFILERRRSDSNPHSPG